MRGGGELPIMLLKRDLSYQIASVRGGVNYLGLGNRDINGIILIYPRKVSSVLRKVNSELSSYRDSLLSFLLIQRQFVKKIFSYRDILSSFFLIQRQFVEFLLIQRQFVEFILSYRDSLSSFFLIQRQFVEFFCSNRDSLLS